MYGQRRGVYRVLVGKPEGKSHLEEQDVDRININMNLQETGCGGMD